VFNFKVTKIENIINYKDLVNVVLKGSGNKLDLRNFQVPQLSLFNYEKGSTGVCFFFFFCFFLAIFLPPISKY
jgi:hypothetical protein